MSALGRRELLAYLGRILPQLDQLSHFELLEVTAETEAKGIREAFYRKAASLHPDLYRLVLGSDDLERLAKLYACIANAYLILRDDRSRAEYARRIGRDGQPTSSLDAEANLPAQARRLYQRARASMRTGDYASAVLNLRMAVASAPASALLREALADALGRTRT